MMLYEFRNLTPARSKVMRAIKGSNTSIELKLRRALFRNGLRYRIHVKGLPGSPDIVFPSKKIAIFCDSDFWHGRTLSNKRKSIRNNRQYWVKKIEDNIKRDQSNNKDLKNMGWRVFRFWETEINVDLDKIVRLILKNLT